MNRDKLTHEIISRRGESSKTYDLGNGKRRAIFSSGVIHYKDDYSDLFEQWKEIDLTWDGKRLDTTPYILEVDDNIITFTDKKTRDSVSISLSRIGESSLVPSRNKIEVIPFNEGVRLQWQIAESSIVNTQDEKQSLSAEFSVDIEGDSVQIRARAMDADGDPVPVEYEIRDGKLYETVRVDLFESDTDKREVRYPITVDPDLTIQPSCKDTYLHEGDPDTNYGDFGSMILMDGANAGRAIIEFDISDLPENATIDDATLSLMYADSGIFTPPDGKTAWAYKLTRTNWVELEATWNIYRTGNSWTSAGGDYVTSNPSGGSTTFPSSDGWMNWNVKAIVEDAYDNDDPAEFLVRFATEGVTENSNPNLRASDYHLSHQRPKLEIDYTEALSKPVVQTNAATSVEATTATLNGEVDDDGGEDCEYRFAYRIKDGTWNYTDWTGAKSTGQTFYEDITGLDRATTYEFMARVRNTEHDSDWGFVLEFDTKAETPVAITKAAGDVGTTSATLNGEVDDDGGKDCQYRFRYRVQGVGDYSYTNWTNGKTTANTFSEGISVLDRATTYEFATQLRNEDEEGDWGVTLNFETLPELPVVETTNADNITGSEARIHGRIDDDGGDVGNCDARFRYKKTSEPTWITTDWQNTLSTNSDYHEDITSLDIGIEYEFQTQARNSEGEGNWSVSNTFNTSPYYASGYIGDVIDCSAAVEEYSRLEWAKEAPTGGQTITIEVRSSVDQSTWSDWETIHSSPGTNFTTPVRRYFEWRATLATNDTSRTPRLLNLMFRWQVEVEE